MNTKQYKKTRLEHALDASTVTLSVVISSDDRRVVSLITNFFDESHPLLPFTIKHEEVEKILLVNLNLIAKRVMDKIPKSDENPSFFSKKAGSFSGVGQRTVQLWTERGLISPDVADTTGTGQRRLYSVLNCIEIGIIQSFAKERLSFKLIRDVMDYLREKGR